MITFSNVTFGYKQPLVSVEELTLSSGTTYALLGRNGKGKSTIINTINGLIPSLAGSITINEKSLHSLNAKERAKIISHVAAKFDGIEHLTTLEYIQLGRTPYLNFLGTISLENKSFVDSVIHDLKITHLANQFTTKISDGERQLAAIARAIVQETPIITLDEPTAFLDYINKKELIEKLQGISKEMSKCILFSTHDIDLCLENNIPILYISKEGKLQQFSGADKATLLSLAF